MLTDMELLDSGQENLKWFQDNSEQIQLEYARKLIAIKGKKIVASAKNIGELLELLRSKEIEQSEVLIEYIPPRGEITIL